ncbi:MAG: DUF4340 domain-containing protein [Deltaproteobacteria bacterium]|nr:DUF4340 domain-containing protein [Deltaproteobacteria bacterium]
MKVKKEYIILLLIIAVLVLYIFMRKESRIQYELPEIAELAPANISSIVINGPESEILLTKEKDKWFIGPEKYVADDYKVKKMVDFLVKPVLTTVVSDSKDYLRYGLDDKTRIAVKALLGETLQRSVEIGYQADIRNHTFIKLEDDHRVYHAREDLRDIFSTRIDDIRDKTVLSFKPDKVDAVYLTKDGKEFAFNKKTITPEGEEVKDPTAQWEAEEGRIVDTALVNSLLDDLLGIKCSEYIYDRKKDELNNPVYIVRIKDENEHILTVLPKEEDDYRAMSSDNPTPFNLYSWRIDNIIKKFDEILGEEDKKGPETD